MFRVQDEGLRGRGGRGGGQPLTGLRELGASGLRVLALAKCVLRGGSRPIEGLGPRDSNQV